VFTKWVNEVILSFPYMTKIARFLLLSIAKYNVICNMGESHQNTEVKNYTDRLFTDTSCVWRAARSSMNVTMVGVWWPTS